MFELFEADLAIFDFGADAGIPTAVAVVEEGIEAAVFTDGGGDFEATGEGVHAADVGMEEVDGVEAFTSAFGIEVGASGGEAAVFEDREHDLGGEVDIGGELVGIPTEEEVAGIGVDTTEGIGGAGDFEFMLHGMSGERGMVGLKVELEVTHEVVFAEEVEAGGCVGVVLVFGGFFGFGFDVELAVVLDGFFVGDGHVEERGQVVEFPFHVGIPEGGIAFASAPEDVAFAVEFLGDFEAFFDLGGGVGEDIGVTAGGGAVHEARVGEEAGGAPEQFDAGVVLQFFEFLDHLVEVAVAFREGAAFRGDVAVVEGVVRGAEFFAELEHDAGAFDGHGNGIGAVFPGAVPGAGAEHVGAHTPHGVPVDHREAQVVFHGFALDDLVGVIVFERERVLGVRSFEFDLRDLRECRWHSVFGQIVFTVSARPRVPGPTSCVTGMSFFARAGGKVPSRNACGVGSGTGGWDIACRIWDMGDRISGMGDGGGRRLGHTG